MKTFWLAATAATALLAATPTFAADLTQTPRLGAWGFDLSGRDTAKRPGDSLFDHANGLYIEKLEIPADRSSYGAFNMLDELSRNRMRAIVEKAAGNTSAVGAEAQVGTLYRDFMDEARIEALGAKPLAKDLAAIRAARSRSDIARLMGATSKGFGQSVFSATVFDDAKDPMKYTVYLGQGGVTLPDRDYYLEDRFAPQRAAYKAYVYLRPECVKEGWTRDRIMVELNEQGVPCFSGSCSQIYREKAFVRSNLGPRPALSVAKELGDTSLMFLVHPTLSNETCTHHTRILSSLFLQALSL